MTSTYGAFQNLPPRVAGRLEKRIIHGDAEIEIPENASVGEAVRLRDEFMRNPVYTEEELIEIVDAFIVFNNAVKRGLPNQLYNMLARTLDTEIAQMAHAAGAIWYAHEDDGSVAKDAVQKFADGVKKQIDKRAGWDEEQFHREYFLGRK